MKSHPLFEGISSPTPSRRFERLLWERNFAHVAGTDEVGCGAWAGPVYAAAVVLPSRVRLPGVTDSKKLSPKQRTYWAESIKDQASAWSISSIPVSEIDTLGIRRASLLASVRALEQLSLSAHAVISDAFMLPSTIPCFPLVRGDSRSLVVATASILAKVARDEHLTTLHDQYPLYGLANHKGYGSKRHELALKAHGPCPEHRRSFKPIKELLSLPSVRYNETLLS